MSEDLTVLLLGSPGPSDQLKALLEKQRIFGDPVRRGELENMMRLADPALLVQFGKDGARDVVEMLRAKPIAERVRLVIIAERPDLPELRKLDREIVASLLATDMPDSVLSTRIGMLAKKRRGPLRAAPLDPKKAPPPPKLELKLAPSPASSKATTSSKPKSDKTPAPPVSSPLSAETSHPAMTKAGPNDAARADSAAQSATPAPPSSAPSEDAQKSEGTQKSEDTQKPEDAQKSKAILRDHDHDEDSESQSLNEQTVEISVIEAMALQSAPPPESEALARRGPPTHITKPMSPPEEYRILVADSDIMRGDAIARNLRHTGLLTLIVPLDPAKTRWPLVRQFAPTLLLVDEHELQSRGQVWYQLLQADQELGKIRLAKAHFADVFDETTGAVDLVSFASHIPELIDATVREPQSTMSVAPMADLDPTTIEEVPESERPTLYGDSNPVARAPEVSVTRSNVDQSDPRVEVESQTEVTSGGVVDTNQADAPIPVETGPVLTKADAGPRSTDLASTTPAPTQSAAENLEFPGRTSRGKKWLVAILLLGTVGGGAWFASKKLLKGRYLEPAPSSAPRATAPKEVDGDAHAPKPEPEPDFSPWIVPLPKEVKPCTEIVDEVDRIKSHGMEQANASWTNARKSLVLGNIDDAHRYLCEASLAHPEGLAVEGLVELLLAKHDTEKAEKWMKPALTARPERRKTIELNGDLLSQLGRVEEAKAAWAAGLNVDPGNDRAIANIGLYYENEGETVAKNENWSKAELMYRRAVTLNEKSARAAAGLAQSFMGQGLIEHADYWSKQAISLDPVFGPALVVRGDLALKAGEKDKALELYKQALETDPGNSRAHQQVFQLEQQK